MPSIAASNAVRMSDRMLPQHQAALTIVKDRVESPLVERFRWLDLACGRGQILLHAKAVFGTCLDKIEYVGVDVDQRFAAETQRSAEKLFRAATIHISELHNFELQLASDQSFDFISFTNAAHEISPRLLASALVSALCRVDGTGQLYMYDMQTLPEPELGAIPWTGQEMQSIVHALLGATGNCTYLPQAAVWPHKSCSGWSIHINRRYLTCSSDDLNKCRLAMIDRATDAIAGILQKKVVETNQSLDLLCRYGASTPEEFQEAHRLTFDYWAISRALGAAARLGSGEI